jgi:hypothetical protein
MAHFAELDANNVVLRVIVLNNEDAQTEEQGISFCKSLFGADTVWLQTSYNTQGNVHLLGGTPFRKNYAGIGYWYSAQLDAFIPPKPEDGDYYSLDEQKGVWVNINPAIFKGVTRIASNN